MAERSASARHPATERRSPFSFRSFRCPVLSRRRHTPLLSRDLGLALDGLHCGPYCRARRGGRCGCDFSRGGDGVRWRGQLVVYVALAMSLPLATAQAALPASTRAVFVVPPELRPQVEFWKRVFATYS